MLTTARKLIGLSAAEWRDMIRAELAVAAASIAVRTRPLGKLVSAHAGERERERSVAPDVFTRAEQLATAMHRAASFGPLRPRCLVRSLALRSLLMKSGILGADIRVGVLRENGKLLAHAWVELNGRVIGDDKYYVRKFVPFAGLELQNSAWSR